MNGALYTMHLLSIVLYSPQEDNLYIQVYHKTLDGEQPKAESMVVLLRGWITQFLLLKKESTFILNQFKSC